MIEQVNILDNIRVMCTKFSPRMFETFFFPLLSRCCWTPISPVDVYLSDADVSADIFSQVDHVSLLSHHHDEARQHLRIEGVHWIFFLLILFRPLLILTCRKSSRILFDFVSDVFNGLNGFPMEIVIAPFLHCFICFKWPMMDVLTFV